MIIILLIINKVQCRSPIKDQSSLILRCRPSLNSKWIPYSISIKKSWTSIIDQFQLSSETAPQKNLILTRPNIWKDCKNKLKPSLFRPFILIINKTARNMSIKSSILKKWNSSGKDYTIHIPSTQRLVRLESAKARPKKV